MEYIRTEEAEGMASNVRANLLSFGVDVYLMTNELKPIKTRFVDERSNQQLMRMDENDEVADYGWVLPTGDTYPTSTPHPEPIKHPFDALIISDYNKGFLDENQIFDIVKEFDGPIFIDSKKSKLPKKGCFLKINELEDSNLKGIYRNKIVTKGSAGAEYKGKIYPGEKVPCFDVAGAGDTFLCALVYFYLEYGKIEKAIPYANKAAAIAVQNHGTYVLSGDDIDDIRS
tara:strand:+ start:553 stop:1239 length:687 start_codon:yes stop_codon:yes gene_type:complete